MAEALRQAVRAGISPETFWRLTPYQTRLATSGYGMRVRDMERISLTQAWLTARMMGAQGLPPLHQLLDGDGEEKPETPEEIAKTLGGMMARQERKGLADG